MKHIRYFLAMGCAVAMLAGCARVSSFFAPVVPPTPSADKLYNDAMAFVATKSYDDAVEQFRRFRELYHDHPLAPTALVLIGDAYVSAEKYDEALVAYDEFLKQHPTNVNVPYVRFKEATCHYNQLAEKDRDQGYTRSAIKRFEAIMTDFPDTPYAVMAYQYMKKCRKRIAEQEIYVGNFYLKSAKYDSAEKRFLFVLKNYADVDIHEDVLYGLYNVYRRTKNVKKAKNIYETLTFYFPASKYIKEIRQDEPGSKSEPKKDPEQKKQEEIRAESPKKQNDQKDQKKTDKKEKKGFWRWPWSI